MRADPGPADSAARLHGEIRGIVAGLDPADAAEEEHQRQALSWLDSTGDIYRRVKPRTPDPHLVSYFLLTDRQHDAILLVDHRKAGLWLPTGGHVDPGEHPVATVRREAREELGIEAESSPATGDRPLFITVTETTPPDPHTDVSLWYVLTRSRDHALTPDPREFRAARWWSREEVAQADPAIFDPHMSRMLAKLDQVTGRAQDSLDPVRDSGELIRWRPSVQVTATGTWAGLTPDGQWVVGEPGRHVLGADSEAGAIALLPFLKKPMAEVATMLGTDSLDGHALGFDNVISIALSERTGGYWTSQAIQWLDAGYTSARHQSMLRQVLSDKNISQRDRQTAARILAHG